MGQNKKQRSEGFPPTSDFALQDRDRPFLGTGDSGQWVYFESLLHIAQAEIPRYQIRLGSGGGFSEQHGTFPYLSGPLLTKASLEPYVGSGWRGVYCRYWDDPDFRELRVQVSGEVSFSSEGSSDGSYGKTSILLKSWYALHYPAIITVVWRYLPDCKPLAFAPK